MLVVHLWDKGPRWPLMFTEGLMAITGLEGVPSVRLVSNKDTVQWGQMVHQASTAADRLTAMQEADLIFLQTKPGYYNDRERRFLTAEGLWDKVVAFDAHDFPVVDTEALRLAPWYFKRLNNKRAGKPIPLDYCALRTYFPGEGATEPAKERDIDLVYLFDQNVSHRRLLVLRLLEAAGFDTATTIIGTRSDNKQGQRTGRFNILDAQGPGNDYQAYLKTLGRAKIVFTCFPHHRNGDIRFWEAMASGALVISDKVMNPVYPPLVPGWHYFEYDAGSPHSILTAIDMAKHALGAGEADRVKVAYEGQRFVWDNHRPLDRMAFVMAMVNGDERAIGQVGRWDEPVKEEA